MSSLAMQTTYEEVQNDISKVAYRFWTQYGGDLECIRADARFHFMGAYKNFKMDRGCHFDNYLCFYVWKQLLETLRTNCKKKSRLGNRHDVHTMDVEDKSNHLISNLVSELSDDAKYVIRLITSPDGLPEAIMSTNFLGVRKNLKNFLRSEGWSDSRVDSVFQEIGDAL